MTKLILAFFISFLFNVKGEMQDILKLNEDKEDRRIDLLINLVTSNLKTNGWNNIIIYGHFPNYLYMKLKLNQFTFVTSNTNEDDYYVEDAVPYHSNVVLMSCLDFENFEQSLLQVINLPYWHPHANVYLYYHMKETKDRIALLLFIFWYYRACNVVLIQHDDDNEKFSVTEYTPYINARSELNNTYGCWTVRKLGIPIYSFKEAFTCEEGCHNISTNPKLRSTSFGTCLRLITKTVSYNETNIHDLNLFEDKGKNFHNFSFRTFTNEVKPFMTIKEHPNNTYTLGSRDGIIWNTLCELLNFTLDLSPSASVLKKPFDFEISIQQTFTVAHRKGDLLLIPIYQFDVIVVEIDYTFPYKESGVCFMSHRADFETILFNVNTLLSNYKIILQFHACFYGIWFVFCLYSATESNKINMDFFGKNFMNAVRSILLVNLHHPPKRVSFRIFLTITIWSFYIINFSTQAAITSFFSAFKRGREVDTFEDIIEKGYRIEGMASPDVVLPDTEERFKKINSKLSPVRNINDCVQGLQNDSQRFCLTDCSVGRYLKINMLNDKGEQYLHIAKDRVHSHYLNFIFPKYSVMTDQFNKYMIAFFEAGLIKKWEDNRFNDIKEEVPTKPLGMADMKGVFNVLIVSVMCTIVTFLIEIGIANIRNIKLLMNFKQKCCNKSK